MNGDDAIVKRQANAAWTELVRSSWMLIAHEVVCWDDLLGSLETFECVSERAAFRLHDALRREVKNGILTKRSDWEPLLNSLGIDPKTRVRDFKPLSAP